MCNLLENAAKYSVTGAQIRVSVRTCDPWLDVAVCNDGPGFPPDRIDKVFDLFVRGERESAVAGTGMGLAICKAIVLAHGGTIAAENLPGVACVRFTLPLGVPPVIEEETPA
jgi:two-component system sensor histidine kinase KdpD